MSERQRISAGQTGGCFAMQDLGYTISEVCIAGRELGSASGAHHPIGGTLNPGRSAIEDVRVDHGSGHVPVPEKLLDRPDVVAVLQQVRGERVAGGMGGGG